MHTVPICHGRRLLGVGRCGHVDTCRPISVTGAMFIYSCYINDSGGWPRVVGDHLSNAASSEWSVRKATNRQISGVTVVIERDMPVSRARCCPQAPRIYSRLILSVSLSKLLTAVRFNMRSSHLKILLFTRTWLRYARVFASANPSVVCLSSVTFVHPTQGVETFGNVYCHFVPIAIRYLREKNYGYCPREIPPSGVLNAREV